MSSEEAVEEQRKEKDSSREEAKQVVTAALNTKEGPSRSKRDVEEEERERMQ
jgi:hypothetical protein